MLVSQRIASISKLTGKVGRRSGTYDSSVRGILRGLSFPTSVLLYFVGDLEGRRFGFGPLGGGLPSLFRAVGSRLDWFLRRHKRWIRVEVVMDESMKVLVVGERS
jgi:hypothetical protein